MISIPNFDCELNPRDFKTGANEILANIRHDWDLDRVTFKRCTNGFINHVTTASMDGGDDKVIIRIFGSQCNESFDRAQQITATLLLNEMKISPRVLCIFKNGFCFEYVEGLVLDWNDFSALDDIRIAMAYARELARFHCNLTREYAINKYKLKERNFVNNHLHTLLGMYPSTEQIKEESARALFEKSAPSKATIAREIEALKKMVDDMKLPLVFCHNDSNATNIIYNKENDLFTAPPSDSPRCQPEYRKGVLLEYLKVKCKLDGEDEGRAMQLFDRCYAQVRKMYLVVSMIFSIYMIDVTLKEVHMGSPIEFMRKALDVYETHYLNCKEELMDLPVPELL
ncbi:probable ethanolamine kinase isoform X2 [Lineus longissimus]|uniref:probable ethanolamine kinase isoform X2 n=1 Tax=Lineus longissimus TaxID=88925 RepID=UPI00315D387E